MGANAGTVMLKQGATFGLRADTALAQCGVVQHFTQRHSGGLQTIEKPGPSEDRCVVITLAGAVPVGMRQQPDPLVITDRVSR